LFDKIPGLTPVMPKGGFFMMVGIDLKKFPKLSSCMMFMEALAIDQNVFVFPSESFELSGSFRIVVTPPEDILVEACKRIKMFCKKHFEA
jgi:tyrosine aminotransferase